MISTWLAILVLVVAVPLTWIVAAILWRESRATVLLKTNRVMRAVSLTLAGFAVLVTTFSIVFINNEQSNPWLDIEQTRLLTRGPLLVISVVVSLLWLSLYRARVAPLLPRRTRR